MTGSGATTTVFVYNVSGQLVAEYGGQAQKGAGGTSYVTQDMLGSTRAVSDGVGRIKSRHDYLPFGEEVGAGIGGRTTQQGYGQPSGIRKRWAQLERDGETGLDYAQARYYSPMMGRFTSVDPENAGADESNPQSWNGYSYALNNPVIFGDPDGLGTKVCDLQGQCHEFTDDEANAGLFNKKWQRENGHRVKGGKIYQNGELIGTYENTGIDGAPFSSALMEAGRYPYGKAVGAFGVASVVGGVTGGVALYYGAPAAAGTGGVLSQGRKVLRRIESAIDDILSSASKGKVSSSRQFNKPGGMNQANKDFNELTKGVKVQTRGQTRTAELENGYKVNVRPGSSGGRPTLEIQKPRGAGKDIKVRYDK